jgi:hypothetical protein
VIRAVVTAVALALLAPAAAQAQSDGAFVDSPTHVYRVVGGAPLHIGLCYRVVELNECSPMDPADPAGLRQYPVDGARTRDYQTGGIFIFAGGAPLWRGDCSTVTCEPWVVVDSNAMADPVHTRELPTDGTVVRNITDGGTYRFAGGAPLLVRCDLECPNPPLVDNKTFAELGYPGARNTMRQYPILGTTVLNTDTNTYYRFVGGSPLPLSSCDGCAAVRVDNRTFELLGTGTPSMPHMIASPGDFYFLTTGAATYRIAGGAAVQLTDCAPLGGCEGAVPVDAGTIASLGGGRLLATPRDGTVLRGLPSKRTWEMVGGKRRETFIARLDAIDVDDGAINLLPADTPAPPPPAPPPPFTPVISSGYKVFRTYTRFTSLKVRGAPAGSIVTVTCKGRGCPFKKARQHRLKGSSLDVRARWFKKARLRNKATVVVRVTGPTGARKQQTFKIRSRKLPVRTTRCSAAGAKFSRCP